MVKVNRKELFYYFHIFERENPQFVLYFGEGKLLTLFEKLYSELKFYLPKGKYPDLKYIESEIQWEIVKDENNQTFFYQYESF